MVMGYPEYEPEDDGPKHAKDYAPEDVVPQPIGETNVSNGTGFLAKFGLPWKSIIGFFGVFFGQVLMRTTVNDIPVFPETLAGWGSLLGASAGAAVVIYLKGNVFTVPQAQKNLEVAYNKAA